MSWWSLLHHTPILKALSKDNFLISVILLTAMVHLVLGCMRPSIKTCSLSSQSFTVGIIMYFPISKPCGVCHSLQCRSLTAVCISLRFMHPSFVMMNLSSNLQEACSLKMQCAQQMAPDAENPTNVTKEGTLLEQAVEESLAAGETFPSSSLVFSGYLQLRAAAFFTFPPGKVFPRLPGVNLLDPLTGSDTECLSGIPEADAASESGATFTPADAAAEGRL